MPYFKVDKVTYIKLQGDGKLTRYEKYMIARSWKRRGFIDKVLAGLRRRWLIWI